MSPTTWRLADLFAKHHFILNGLGWGGMPLHAVREDLEEGRLAILQIEDVPPGGLVLPMSAVWQTKSPPGPAGRWFIERLKEIPVSNGDVPQATRRRKRGENAGPDKGRSRIAYSFVSCPLLAQSGHSDLHCTCPLLGVKPTRLKWTLFPLLAHSRHSEFTANVRFGGKADMGRWVNYRSKCPGRLPLAGAI